MTTGASSRGSSAETSVPSSPRAAWTEIGLDRLERNVRGLRRRIGGADILAVVKANAYGHGAVAVSRTLEASGVGWFGVAFAAEGAELRRAGVEGEIVVLGPAQPDERELYVDHALVPVVSSMPQLAMFEEWERAPSCREIHLKVDTGMGRLGIDIEELDAALDRIRRSGSLELAGVLSHLGEADDLDSSETAVQSRRFDSVVARLTPEERDRVVLHLANSAAALHHPTTRHDLVRLGLSLYGYDPAGIDGELEPVMRVVARLVQVRTVAAGDSIGYGGRWTAERDSRVGVVPVGYADGYPWRLGNRAEVLVHGRRAPVVGAVSMDMTFVDLTGLDGALGDEVVLLGRSGEESIDARELAARAGTIPYEILSLLGLRLPRHHPDAEASQSWPTAEPVSA